MTRKQRRSVLILTCLGVFALAVGLIGYGFSSKIAYFVTPRMVGKEVADFDRRLRLGGLVKKQSVVRGEHGQVTFAIEDPLERDKAITVSYKGALPDLFREGQGVVVEGRLSKDLRFSADTLFAKHDEKYIPAELVDDMKKRGVWKGEPE